MHQAKHLSGLREGPSEAGGGGSRGEAMSPTHGLPFFCPNTRETQHPLVGSSKQQSNNFPLPPT